MKVAPGQMTQSQWNRHRRTKARKSYQKMRIQRHASMLAKRGKLFRVERARLRIQGHPWAEVKQLMKSFHPEVS